jgi:hypothetical protein
MVCTLSWISAASGSSAPVNSEVLLGLIDLPLGRGFAQQGLLFDDVERRLLFGR